RDIETTGKRLASALVQHGEPAGPLLSLLNWAGEGDTVAARKGWPAVKVALQEAAIRLRLRKDDAPQPTATPPRAQAGTDDGAKSGDAGDDETYNAGGPEPDPHDIRR